MFRRTQDTLRREYFVEYRAVTFYGGSFQIASSKIFLCNSKGVSYNPKEQALWFGLVPFRSPLLGKSHLLSLPPGTKMFQFPGSASFTLCIQINVLLHYEQWVPPIRKSLYPSTYDSTRLIGVSPVLLRLLVPRHPPCALIHLTYERFKTFKTLFDVVG